MSVSSRYDASEQALPTGGLRYEASEQAFGMCQSFRYDASEQAMIDAELIQVSLYVAIEQALHSCTGTDVICDVDGESCTDVFNTSDTLQERRVFFALCQFSSPVASLANEQQE